MTPDQVTELFERLGGIDAKLATQGRQVTYIENRVKKLEWWKAKVAGMAIVSSAVIQFLVSGGKHGS